MKKDSLILILFPALFLFLAPSLHSQSPQGIPYQAMIRDNNGSPLQNIPVSVRFTLHQNEIAGPVEYQEIQILTTNSYGLVNAIFGQGIAVQGVFSGIVWSNTVKFIQVEANDGNGYMDMGTQQMMSVPYAMYAANGPQGPQGPQGEPGPIGPNGDAGQDGIGVSNVQLENNSLIITLSDGSIINAGTIELVSGCTEQNACNYNSLANINDYSCLIAGSVCDDNNVNTINDIITINCVCQGTLNVQGCTQVNACNFNPFAVVDDGSCLFIGSSCSDGNAITSFDVINASCVCAGSVSEGSGSGSSLLPGIVSCADVDISVTGCNGQSSIDYHSVNYDLIEIGGQCWFAENLATTTLNDNSPIIEISNTEIWSSTSAPAYCNYNNDVNYASLFGLLYNAYVATSNVCPVGWHVPNDCEWMYLESILGMSTAELQLMGNRGTDQGGKLKSITGWNTPNTGATNAVGFSAKANGSRSGMNTFYTFDGHYGEDASWWTSNNEAADLFFARWLRFDGVKVGRTLLDGNSGLAIRCIKN